MKRLVVTALAAAMLVCVFIPASAVKTSFDYLGFRLGMSEDEVNTILSANSRLKVNESRYLGKINDPVPFILKITYEPYIPLIYLQFYSNQVCVISVYFNQAFFDFYTLAETLENKYGTPALRTPQLVRWDSLTNTQNPSNTVRMQLEYPTTVKVMDYSLMLRLNEETSNAIFRITNNSIIQSNKRELLNSF